MEKLQNAFGIFGVSINHPSFVRTLTSAVTTAWGVDWDEQFIARDLMQNFFDANRNCVDEIQVITVGNDVMVSAPSSFNLDRLFYLGSEKGNDDVGQYGEGFKAAATCLLRDHSVSPIVMSGHDIVVLRIADERIANTNLFPVEYDFYRCEKPTPGTTLILPRCSMKLVKAMSEGLAHFFYDKNPLLGQRLWTCGSEFSIYKSTDNRGHVFYRKLKRGSIEGIPLVLVIDKEYASLERKISKDRDRNAFGDDVMKIFYSHFSRFGIKDSRFAQEIIVQEAQTVWQKGHPLLQAIADTVSNRRRWSDESAAKIFGSGKYYSSVGSYRFTADQVLENCEIERTWQKQGRTVLPGYFNMFGVQNVSDEIRRIRKLAFDESKRENQRPTSPAEQVSIDVLSRILKNLDPELMAIFEKGDVSYLVAQTESLLGELKQDRAYRSRQVFFAESVFLSDFPQALAIFLHEHAHIFGHDGSRGFTDALTNLLETVTRERHHLDQYEVQWQEARDGVRLERLSRDTKTEQEQPEGWLSDLDVVDLRALLLQLPPVTLARMKKMHLHPSS